MGQALPTGFSPHLLPSLPLMPSYTSSQIYHFRSSISATVRSFLVLSLLSATFILSFIGGDFINCWGPYLLPYLCHLTLAPRCSASQDLHELEQGFNNPALGRVIKKAAIHSTSLRHQPEHCRASNVTARQFREWMT